MATQKTSVTDMRIIPEEEEVSQVKPENQTMETSLLDVSIQTAHKTSKMAIKAKISKILEVGSSTSADKNQTMVLKASSYSRVKHFSFE